MPIFSGSILLVFLFTFSFVFGQTGDEKLLYLTDPVNINKIPKWAKKIEESGNDLYQSSGRKLYGITECRELMEIKHAILCLSYSKVVLHKIFARASLYIEGNEGDKNDLITNFNSKDYYDKLIDKYLYTVSGYDLVKNDLLRFHSEALKLCEKKSNPKECFYPAEQQFYEKVFLPHRGQSNDLVIIGSALYPGVADILFHELLHAKYFLEKGYKHAVDDFWRNQLTESDRLKIMNIFKIRRYDTTNELLVMNEFQAFALMRSKKLVATAKKPIDILHDSIEDQLNQYHQPLSDYLKKINISVFNIPDFKPNPLEYVDWQKSQKSSKY